MIFADQPPYCCKFDFSGTDSTATDNYSALQQAINDAATIMSPGTDLGGSMGNTVMLPKGAGLISQKLVIPAGVVVSGVCNYGSVLKMADAFSTEDHFVDLGDATKGVAAMGCGLKDLILYSRNTNADFNKAMVYSNNAQDHPLMRRMRIYAGNRIGVWGEIGYGGASGIAMSDISLNNNGAHGGQNLNPVMVINYGPGTIVDLERLNINGPSDGSGGPNQVGVWVANGNVRIRSSHFEEIATGIMCALQNPSSMLLADQVTGGNLVNAVVRIQSPTPAGRTAIGNASQNGAANVVLNLNGGGSAGDIVGQRVF